MTINNDEKKANDDIKKIVRDAYSQIAHQSREENIKSCCGCACDANAGHSVFARDYSGLEGHYEGADLGLGCGIPTQFAKIKEGDTVIDLGSGAGNDCFVARAIVGETGLVIGIDMTEAMIKKARDNASKLGYDNVEFRLGEIENLPVEDQTADVVVSNCVLNLVPDKGKAISEIFRIMKKSGHFCISDVVTRSSLPDGLRKEASLYAGCVSGALSQEEYIRIIETAGFKKIKVHEERKINLPKEMLMKYMSQQDVDEFLSDDKGIFSITVYAKRPCGEQSCKCGTKSHN